jgi:hypothetical protein
MAKKKAPRKVTLTPKQKAAREWLSGEKDDSPVVSDGVNPNTQEKRDRPVAKTAAKKKRVPSGESKAAQIRTYAEKHPKATTKEVAKAVGTSYNLVYQTLKKAGGKSNSKAKAKKASKVAGHEVNGHHHHTATEFVKAALNLGLDEAIYLLQKVKDAVS